MLRRPPRSTLFPYRRSSDLARQADRPGERGGRPLVHRVRPGVRRVERDEREDRKSTRLNSSHLGISYAVFCLKKKKKKKQQLNNKKYINKKGTSTLIKT